MSKYLMNYRFGSIYSHLHKKKPKKDTSEGTAGGKLIEIAGGIAEAIETETAGPSSAES